MNEIYSIQHRLGIVDFTSISKPQINWLCTAWAVRRERFFIVQVYGYINWCGVVIVSLVSPCSTVRGREVQRLVALYPTVRLSPWRQVRKNIHSRVWTPGPTWSVLHPGGPPLLVPLSSCTGGYGPHSRRLIRTPVQGGYPRFHLILSLPRRASLLVPLPLELSATRILPITFVCFLCISGMQNLYA